LVEEEVVEVLVISLDLLVAVRVVVVEGTLERLFQP
jgi:hypothetical protein